MCNDDLCDQVKADMRAKLTEQEAELTAIRESMRWIPVSERLPPEGSKVLLYHKDWGTGIGSRRGNEISIGLCEDNATHWMLIRLPPLPPQPTEKDDG